MSGPDPIDNAFRLVLGVTYRCNLACPYCYVRPSSTDTMSEPDALRAVDLALGRLDRGGRLYLGFFGGEPLLELDLVTRVADLARARAERIGARVLPRLTTNGTCLDERAVSELAKREFEITVSLDGTPQAHDANRRFRAGDGSHGRVVEGIRRVLEGGLPVRTHSVVDPSNVAWLAQGVEQIASLGVVQVEVDPNYETEWTAASLDQLEKQYQAIGDRYVEWCRAGRPIVVSFIESKLAASIRGGTPLEGRCSFGVREWAVDPRGRIYPCERLIRDDRMEEMVIGRLPEGVDAERLEKILAPRTSIPADCQGCGLEPLCVHWCACVNYRRTGSIAEPDGLICFVEELAARVTERVVRTTIGFVPAAAGGGQS